MAETTVITALMLDQAGATEPDPRLGPGLMSLVQWLSPAFPTGSYAYSHGLEWAISAGDVADAETLRRWLVGTLLYGAGRSDAILLANGLRAEADLALLADLALALAASAERARETLEQGAAFALATNAVCGTAEPARPYPVAVAAAAARLDVAAPWVVALFLQALAANLVGAAVRFMPLGQAEGQRLLTRLLPLCRAVAAEAVATPLEEIETAALHSDLASMHHETMSPRIFKT